jgi:hypothetical protein
MELKPLRAVKKGEFFKLKPEGKVMVRDDYCRGSKRFTAFPYEDCFNYKWIKPSKLVYVGFTY